MENREALRRSVRCSTEIFLTLIFRTFVLFLLFQESKRHDNLASLESTLTFFGLFLIYWAVRNMWPHIKSIIQKEFMGQ